MFDFTKLRDAIVTHPAFAKNFWQNMFDVIADDIGTRNCSGDGSYIRFTFDQNSFPAETSFCKVFQNYWLRVSGNYYLNGDLSIFFVTEPPQNADDDIVEMCNSFESVLSSSLESNGFEWDEDVGQHIIHILGTINKF